MSTLYIRYPANSGSSGSVTGVGALDSETPSSNGASISGNNLILQSASATEPGLVNTTTQNFAGNKTFTGQVTVEDGSANAPGLNFNSSPTAGLYRMSSSQPLAFTTAGILAGYFDNNQNFTVVGTITASNFSGTSSGTNTGDQTTITGNAGSATVLQTARAINGVNFDGSAAITVTAAAGTLTGTTLNSTVTTASIASLTTSITLTKTQAASTFFEIDNLNSSAGAEAQFSAVCGDTTTSTQYAYFHSRNRDTTNTNWYAGTLGDNNYSIAGGTAGASPSTTKYFSISTAGLLKIGNASSSLGFYGGGGAVKASAYTLSNNTPTRSLNVSTATLANVANVLSTLITDLQAVGLVG